MLPCVLQVVVVVVLVLSWLVPFVNTADEAGRGARAVRYPPAGTRGYGPARASKYGLEAVEYFATANDSIVYIPIIEDVEAVRNCEALLAVEGVDILGKLPPEANTGAIFSAGLFAGAEPAAAAALDWLAAAMDAPTLAAGGLERP